MRLKVIATGSKGNCYLLYNEQEALLIEAGVPFKNVMKQYRDVGKINGCLVTHEHKDHAGYVNDLLKHGIPVHMTKGTAFVLNSGNPLLKTFTYHSESYYLAFDIGGFQIYPFDIIHDASQPCGFIIYHKEMGAMMFATDTNYIGRRYNELNHILIECNFDEDMLEGRKDLPEITKQRIRDNHMSVRTCVDMLQSADLKSVVNVMLLHMSEGSADEKLLRGQVQAAIGDEIVNPVSVARAGLDIPINLTPF